MYSLQTALSIIYKTQIITHSDHLGQGSACHLPCYHSTSCLAGRAVRSDLTELEKEESVGPNWFHRCPHRHAFTTTALYTSLQTPARAERRTILQMLHDTKIGTSNQDVTNEDTTVKWWTKREQMKKRKTSALAFRAPTERCYSWYSKCVTTSIYSSSEIFSIPWSSHRHWVRGWLTAATLGQDDGNFQETAVSHAVWLSENHMYTRARPTSEPPPRAVPSPSFCRLLIQQQQSLLDAQCDNRQVSEREMIFGKVQGGCAESPNMGGGRSKKSDRGSETGRAGAS